MATIQFNAVVGADGLIRPRAGIVLPQGEIEVVVRPRSSREERLAFAEGQLRRACNERGLNWDAMSAEERETFIDDLVHDDRACG